MAAASGFAPNDPGKNGAAIVAANEHTSGVV
jgi:hypothetical protein